MDQYAEFIEKEVPTYRGFLYAMTAGSTLTSAAARRLWGRLALQVVSTYGSTETGTASTVDAHTAITIEGAVGPVIPGMTVEIVGAGGELLRPGHEGRVRIRGDAAVSGYYRDPETSQSKFDTKGFYPGDLGLMTPAGVLVITGRENAVINVGGDKISPERIEAAVVAFAGVSDAAVTTAQEPQGSPGIGCTIVWRGPENLEGLKEHLRQALPARFIPRTFRAVTSIPRNASGKIERR
ncbi:MAG: fatty acid--CoA ligase family protein [Hyphomicrobiaceae bacterium]|nr:fatty acid--CoA ligase family protein [Hyphomicrobiaceae bacterium]